MFSSGSRHTDLFLRSSHTLNSLLSQGLLSPLPGNSCLRVCTRLACSSKLFFRVLPWSIYWSSAPALFPVIVLYFFPSRYSIQSVTTLFARILLATSSTRKCAPQWQKCLACWPLCLQPLEQLLTNNMCSINTCQITHITQFLSVSPFSIGITDSLNPSPFLFVRTKGANIYCT